jgi:hypothetical protein
MEPEFQPDINEVLQDEAVSTISAIPVCVDEIKTPVRTQVLPHIGTPTTLTKTFTTTAIKVLPSNPRRATFTVLAIDNDILIAFNAASKEDSSTMAYWPKLIPLRLTHCAELWIASATTTSKVSIITERWAAGE